MILQSKYIQNENGDKFAPITTPNAVRWPDGSNLNDKLGGIAQDKTWSQLKTLRDGGNLVPGQYYRITDYVTTTAKSDTLSVGHAFDIIVRADTSNKLNEDAYASLHSGDTYFTNCKLEAWRLWYCLDNDTDRFDWAADDIGTGVIYRMIDEYGNDCPYDFKNIQFKRYKITACPNSPDLVGYYSVSGITGITVNTSTTYWCYTFSMIDNIDNSGAHDVSVEQNKYISDENTYYCTHDNIIKLSGFSETGQLKLPNNVFVTDTDLCSVENDYSYGEFYGYSSNTFETDCSYNTFGNSYFNNTFGNNCNRNTFGKNCHGNTFRNSCSNNIFGISCSNNTFGDYCSYNTFGDDCYDNIFGISCSNNTFGDYCSYNTFGDDCDYIKFQKNYTWHVIVENGNKYINLTSTATTSSSYSLRNITIAQGYNNTITTKTISHGTLNDLFRTTYGNLIPNVTYSQLVALRTANNLTPGQWYRITDYVTTTVDSNTQSAGHAFDIIVRANTANKLCEDAHAVLHSGDTYFANCKLESWKLRYCLDNDTDRFEWADSTNGKGVIYRMIDEYGNDCPYDFKNIQFKRYKITACADSPGLIGSYSVSGIPGITVNTSTTYWCYTFSMIDNIDNSGAHDVSVEQNKYLSSGNSTNNNIIKSTYVGGYYRLRDNVFVTDTDLCSIGDDYSYGDFYGCNYNTFGNYCYGNTFGNDFHYNTFGVSCYENTFGTEIYGNTFGISCNRDIFGDSCTYNTFGNYCYGNTFGYSCDKNIFGDSCSYNTFGNYCAKNTFGNDCNHIKFQKNHTQNVIVESGNKYINLTSTATTSSSALLYNIKISQGCNPVVSAKTISHNTVNDPAPTTYKSTDSVEKLI